MNPNVEMTNAGLKYKGSWNDICFFARNLEEAMKKCVPDHECVEQYDEWRPREEEGEDELMVKTAEKAAIKQTGVEERFNGTKKELSEAKGEFKKSLEDVKNGENPSEEIKDASKHIERVVEVKALESLRRMEETIYERIMLRFNPYYFDTEDFSVNLEEKKDNYFLTVNISDEDIRKDVKKLMKEEKIQC